jgi:flagellin-like hook-associated protein FlgL
MSVVINTNFAATLAADNLATSSGLLQRSLNRLSSGSKIVAPQDDAAGLAVAMKLSATARRQSAASTNIANGLSFLQTQDGALKVAGAVLNRISELKTLYADPTKNSDDLANYESEFTQLQAQLNTLAGEKFNGRSLFTADDLAIATTGDGAGSVTLAGIELLSSGGTVTNLTLDFTSQDFTPSGAGTLTVTSGDLDFVASGNTYLDNGQSATYDGAGNWTLPAPRDAIAGGATIALSTLNAVAGTATFTASATNTSLGDIASAGTLGGLALSTITDAIGEIATFRANNGAQQSRLQFADEVLRVNQANIQAAHSRISDVDVAEESTQLARYNILVQSGTAMLSQANQSAQMALRLLG